MASKKSRLSLIILLLLAGAVHAQPLNVVKMNPLSLFAGTLNVQYERAMGEKWSLQAGTFVGRVGLQDNDETLDGRIDYRMLGLTAEARYHATYDKRANPRGAYFAPYLRYRQIRQAYDGTVVDPDTTADVPAEIRFRRWGFGG
ncbi:MAG: DUF3575 domain-containing protein, partial [Bacteroidota bacterium]